MARDTQRFDLIFALPNDVAKCEVHVAYDTCSVELLELASDTFCFLSGVIKVYYRIYVPPNGGFGRGVVVQPHMHPPSDILYKLVKISHRTFKVGQRQTFAEPSATPVKIDVCFTMHMSKQSTSEQLHQSSLGQLTPFFQDIFESGKDSDFTIVCGDRQLKVHKIILRMQSAFFATTFDTEIEGAMKSSVDLSHCDYRVLYEALKFCYSDQTPPKEMAIELLQLANELLMPKLKAWAANVVTNQLTDENVCDILVLADKLHELGLKFDARCYFLEHCRAVIHTESYKNLPPSLVRELMETLIEANDSSIATLAFPAC
uniref:BTB domain-containing protein n=2 Tax=Plectus sambesii TaxID=2011161 RepID=A0A914VVU5_9BILA